MANATRTGLKIVDPLEIIERHRIRRDLLLVDNLAFDDRQLALARRYAELQCELHDKDPAPILRRFDEDCQQLTDLGRLKSISLRDAVPSAEMHEKITGMDQRAEERLKERPQPYHITLRDGTRRMIDPFGTYVRDKAIADLHRARCLSTQLTGPLAQFIPLATGGPFVRVFEQGERPASVLRVVLANLPVPAPDTPLKQVLEFTADPNVRAQLTRLRSWMVDISASPMSEGEMQTKLESALADYTAAMNLHKCKTVAGTWEVVLTTAAEILESAVRLKFSDAVKKVFQLFKEDCALLEAELASPGRELAFIDSAVKKFS